jgi:peptide/histidine transporter 3/4
MFIALLTCHTAVSANIIQFGMDQLYDSPMEDSALFIVWFVFTTHLGFAIFKLGWIETAGSILLYSSILIALLTLRFLVSLCVAQYNKRQSWFMIDRGSRNPYKMVYQMIQFTMQHKVPVHRSAFTYCDDELPTRIDFGKERYGGPFSTEQVEDVKAFLGILCLLLTLGPVFSSDIARNSLMYGFSIHLVGGLSDMIPIILYALKENLIISMTSSIWEF